MKKTSLILTLSVSAAILLGGVSAMAAPTYIDSEMKKENDLKFEITTKDKDDVKDPEIIDGGGHPETTPVGPVIPHKGDLAITIVPHLNFGKIKLGGSSEVAYQGIFKAKPYKSDGTVDEGKEETEYKPGLRVDDIRGTNGGWRLTAQMGEVATDKGVIMKGAKLLFPEVATKTNVEAGNGVTKSRQAELLSDNQPATVLFAANGTGAAGTQATYFNGTKEADGSTKRDNTKEIKLTIPAGSLVGNYSAKMTYNLIADVAPGVAE